VKPYLDWPREQTVGTHVESPIAAAALELTAVRDAQKDAHGVLIGRSPAGPPAAALAISAALLSSPPFAKGGPGGI
jgi:hypothetical protein